MITIQINESPVEITTNSNILEVLKQIDSPLNGIAVAINAQVIPQSYWESITLKPSDDLLIIQATQGG